VNVHEAMAELLHFARLEIQLLLWGFVAVVFYQMMTGGISLKGLLSDGPNSLSGPRIQMLVTNFVVLAAYLGDPAEITRDSTQSALATAGVMGGSNLLHLVHKYRILKGS